jgi:hypothetical protein
MRTAISCVTVAALLALGTMVRAQVADMPALADPAPAATGLPPPHAGDAAPPRLGPIVLLRTDSGRATLQVQTQLHWQDVCVTPCGIPVDPRGLYRVGGSRLVPSDTFTMPRPSGQVTIEAHMGSRARNRVGPVLTLLGLGVGGFGAFLIYDATQQRGDAGVGAAAFAIYGAIAAISGIAMTVTGTALWATSGTTVNLR